MWPPPLGPPLPPAAVRRGERPAATAFADLVALRLKQLEDVADQQPRQSGPHVTGLLVFFTEEPPLKVALRPQGFRPPVGQSRA